MQEILLTVAVAVAGYLLGCISTGILVSSHAGVNIRTVGSHNTGASNVLRVLGLKNGVITFVGDFLKATLACWVGSLLLPGTTYGIVGFGMMLGGLCAVIGHNWPVFFGFKGGKGVACSAAVIFFVNPLWGGVAIAVCVAVVAATRYISLGSMMLLLCYMVLMMVTHSGQWAVYVFTATLFALVVVRHRENIQRLLNGTENKIGKKITPDVEKEKMKQ
ncbi:MAG: glycerol-3-phosphate 1-O-acyltransferase PlsY [Eubacteriales bacterium]|nr:glycerol-3-phosphate 1-O-acyltransferase PlsY [Eubacteriales bacterium]